MKSTVLDKPKKTSFGHLLIAAVLGIFGLAMLWRGLAPSVASHRTSASIAATQQAGPKYETKKFKDIRKGDMVLARDEYGNEIGLRRVVELYRSTSDHQRILEFESDGGTLQKLETTDEHPFWDEKKATHVAAKDLCVGDQVVGPNGEPSRLDSTRHEPHPEGIEVFNFQVEGAHTYYVKSHGINAPPVLVHNACSIPRGGRQVRIRDLNPLDDAAHSTPRPSLQQLTDDELLNAARNPVNGDKLVRNTRTGKLMDGNGRAHELLRRAKSTRSSISPDDFVPIDDYMSDLSMFLDLE